MRTRAGHKHMDAALKGRSGPGLGVLAHELFDLASNGVCLPSNKWPPRLASNTCDFGMAVASRRAFSAEANGSSAAVTTRVETEMWPTG